MAPTSSSVRPYCGREPYIFISYAHRNETEVYRIIERMQAEGYRIWYDRGIDPGTEWADNIAERVASCDYFIAFITKEYLKSTNCLDELSFARDKEKKRLLVYLSNVTLPDGISMRSNRLQAIHKYAYAQEEEFYEKLFRAKGIDSSRAASSDRPESAVAPYVEESPRESEERISAPLPGGEACQEQRAERTQPAVLPSAAVQAVAARFAAALWRHRRFLLLAAAACTVLFLISSGLFEKKGTDTPGDRDAAEEEEPEIVLDSKDLGGMAFGMSLEEIRAVLTAGGMKENSTAYDAEGMLLAEYVPVGDAYGKEAGSIIEAQSLYGREIRNLTAYFGAEGLYQVRYTLDAEQDANGKALLKNLSAKYGSPSIQYDSSYQWVMVGDVALGYFPVSGVNEDVIRIAVPHETYLDMRGFVWGMSPDETKEAEEGQELPLTLTKSGQNSDGCPYQFYEGEWEVYGSPVELATLNFMEDQLVEMKYILSGRSYDRVVADCTALYGQGGAIAQDGSAMGWNVWMFRPDTGSSVLIGISVVKAENGARLTFRDLERYEQLRP